MHPYIDFDVHALRTLRKGDNTSKRELSKLSGLSRATILQLEVDTPRNVSLDTINKLAKALNVHPKELIRGL